MTTQLSGVRSPFSLRFARLFCYTIVLSLSLEVTRYLLLERERIIVHPVLEGRAYATIPSASLALRCRL